MFNSVKYIFGKDEVGERPTGRSNYYFVDGKRKATIAKKRTC